jgi:hypothetical protein
MPPPPTAVGHSGSFWFYAAMTPDTTLCSSRNSDFLSVYFSFAYYERRIQRVHFAHLSSFCRVLHQIFCKIARLACSAKDFLYTDIHISGL